MKSYRQLAEEARERIIRSQDSGSMKEWDCLIDSGLAFIDRDHETSTEDKKSQYRDILARLEKEMETAPPRRCLNLVFCYVAVRQRIEPTEAGETAAAVYHIKP